LDIQDELEKGGLMKNSKFEMCVPGSPSLSSIDTVMGTSMKECTPTLSETDNVSSVEYAGRFVFPDIYDDEFNTSSKSVWSLETESTSLSQPNWASVRCLKEFSDAGGVRAESDIALTSKFTKLCLKDLPSNSYDENLFYEENKMPTSTNTRIIDYGIITTDKIYCSKEAFFNGIKVNLRIAQF